MWVGDKGSLRENGLAGVVAHAPCVVASKTLADVVPGARVLVKEAGAVDNGALLGRVRNGVCNDNLELNAQ